MKNGNLKFKILPHRADLKIQVYGKTKRDLFKNALLATIESMKPEMKNIETKREIKIRTFRFAQEPCPAPFQGDGIRTPCFAQEPCPAPFQGDGIRTPCFAQEPCFHSRRIKIKSLDLPTLLVDFLSEVLYLTQVNKEIYNDVKFTKFSDTPSTNSGQAELEGELIGQKVERFGEDIKAVTYHNLDVHQKKDGTWEATVLFDI